MQQKGLESENGCKSHRRSRPVRIFHLFQTKTREEAKLNQSFQFEWNTSFIRRRQSLDIADVYEIQYGDVFK